MLNKRNIFSLTISFIGLILLIGGGIQVATLTQQLTFYLLLTLAILTQSTMTAMVGGTVSVSVSSAISLAAVPLFGPFTAVLIASAAEIGMWAISLRSDNPGWQRALERLGVNVGINGIAVLIAGFLFVYLQQSLGSDSFWGQTVPWLIAAVVGDQVNLWLISLIVYLAHGVKPINFWRENRWAIPINVLVMSVGGGLLAVAVEQFDLLGIAIFFLPIMLSAYSFRLTVMNTKKQMEKLEDVVAQRTQALASANVELEELHKDKNAFLAVLTHDMRTPLTSIRGYASILRDREVSPEQLKHIAKVLLHSQNTLLEIVNNILELEKLQSGTPVQLETTTYDFALDVKMSVESIEAQAAEKRIHLTYDPVPSPLMVTADQAKIQRVILNLISNAVKYTPEEGEVCVEAFANGKYATFKVSDTGYGIPEDELPHIFDRYSRVKGHQHLAVGTGLGLAIVKSLVEAHNGEITAVSEEGVGSTFTMKLPL